MQPNEQCAILLFQARHITSGVTTIDNRTLKVFHEVIIPSSVSPSEKEKDELTKELASQLSWSDYWLASSQKSEFTTNLDAYCEYAEKRWVV
jgi:hypothetical protein